MAGLSQELPEISRGAGASRVVLRAVALGADWNLSISGGDRPHIGAVALAVPRPSLRDPAQTSATVSVLTLSGHKEDLLARAVAENCASVLNAVIVVACGIHQEQASQAEIADFEDLVQACVAEFLHTLEST